MRVEISIQAQGSVTVPYSYNHIVQGFIYMLLDPVLRRTLHEEGYAYEKRKFRLFTFSRLMGKFRARDNSLEFSPPVKLHVSSPKSDILRSLTEGLFKKDKFALGSNDVFVESINVLAKPDFKDFPVIKILSPMTVYSTLTKADGAKKTYYYSPFEKEFGLLIKNNLLKKYEAAFNKNPEGKDFSIVPYKVRPSDEKVILYARHRDSQVKPTVIKAWMGLYKIEGDRELVELAYDAGLGSKNSQGFGCWEVYDRQ